MLERTEKVPNLPKRLALFINPTDILLPGCVKSFRINEEVNKNLLVAKLKNGKYSSVFIGVVHSTDVGIIGTAAYINKATTSAIFSGFCRFRIDEIVRNEPYIVANITQIDKHTDCEELFEDPQVISLSENIRDALTSVFDGDITSIINTQLAKIPPCHLAEVCSQIIRLSFEEQLAILNELNVIERLKLILTFLKQNEKKAIYKKPRVIVGVSPMQSSGVKETPELLELMKKLKDQSFPPDVEKVIKSHVQNLTRIPSFNPEYGSIFTYLSLIADLPWNNVVEEMLDLQKAKDDLEVDHYGLENVKKRVLEYLAVKKLRKDGYHQGPILCLVGPPGVGKTSVARSIAATLNRPFVRVSLGGVNDMSDIRGHRRTYVGSMPGRIIQAIKRSGVKNPVILLDEIDKMTYGIRGNPAAALLEVLDPSQNKEFMDHYLNVPFDLSQILFIATANSVKGLTPALYDRLEMIKISGYTYLEKIEIAKKYLLPKQLKENGLNPELLAIPDETIQLLIHNYTREAGVRNLERKIGSLCRSVAVKCAMNEATNGVNQIVVNIEITKEILGPVTFDNNKWSSRLGRPGVAVGLVVTDAGGDTLAVESSFMSGSGKLILTGSLGDVMKESAQLAWGWVRANAHLYGLDLDGKRITNMDVHIHFPEGAVSKDGPSAGVTIATTLISLFLDRPLLPNFAMTGELTLQGLVLPVGGIKEKVIAAHKDGFTKIIIPQQNAKNLHDIPSAIKDDLTIKYCTIVYLKASHKFQNDFYVSNYVSRNNSPSTYDRTTDENNAGRTDKDKFQVKMDVQHFDPSEISVKMVENNTVVVEAKHEEKADDKGFISRQMLRKILKPKNESTKIF
ncbi:Lon protease [Carabus blaptoides fortunei]